MDSMKHYSTYQSQFIEMFGNYEMNANFGDLFSSARNGANIKQGTISGGIPITRIETISEGEINRDKMGYAGIVDNTYSSYYLQDGDILVSHINSMKHIGKCTLYQRINDETIIHGMNLLCLRPYKDIVNPQYVTYLLRSSIMRKLILDITKPAVNQASFTVKDLCKLKVMLPPISEQEEFVAIVDQADKSKFTSLKSQFIEMFGDPMTNSKEWPEYGKINQYAQVILGTTPNSKEASYWDGDIKWITPAEMTDESYYIYDTERHITEEGVKSASLTLLPYRSVLFSTRAPIGKVGLAGSPMYSNQGFKNFICGEKLNPVYLYYSLIYKRDYLISLGTGTTFKELSKKTVEGLNMAVPPLHLQDQFESIYDQADKSKLELLQRMESINYIN